MCVRNRCSQLLNGRQQFHFARSIVKWWTNFRFTILRRKKTTPEPIFRNRLSISTQTILSPRFPSSAVHYGENTLRIVSTGGEGAITAGWNCRAADFSLFSAHVAKPGAICTMIEMHQTSSCSSFLVILFIRVLSSSRWACSRLKRLYSIIYWRALLTLSSTWYRYYCRRKQNCNEPWTSQSLANAYDRAIIIVLSCNATDPLARSTFLRYATFGLEVLCFPTWWSSTCKAHTQ